MLKTMTLISLVSFATITYADQTAQAPARPPEVKKTVDAFAGRWNFAGTDLEPGTKQAAKLTMTINCKPAALGAAVACTIAGRSAGERIEAAAVIGYSPDEKVVRWMEISSTAEYHDHRGVWKGNTIEFEPLPYTVMGKRFVEKLNVSFPSPGTLVLKSVTETPEGSSTLEGTARRPQSSQPQVPGDRS